MSIMKSRSHMKDGARVVVTLAAVVLAAAGMGCGGGGGGRLEAPAIGFSMDVPAGWEVSPRTPDLCFHGEGNGMVMVEPIPAGGFERHVAEVSREYGARVLSRKDTRAAGHRAVEVVSEVPAQGVTALRLFIDLGSRVATVSFVTPSAEFDAQEPAIRAAFETITLE